MLSIKCLMILNNIEKYLNNKYRKFIWDKSKDLITKISTVIDIDTVTVLGSFTTKKERPADVDFIVMIKSIHKIRYNY